MSDKPADIYEEKLIEIRDGLVETVCEDFGVSLTDAAFIFKISKQRVSQILNSYNNKNNDRRIK